MRYLAPEQLRGAPSTPASDLHSLAAVAYEMLSGHHAYAVTSPVALAEAQIAGPAPLPGVAPAVDAIVRRALAVEPSDRPRSVTEFAASLEAAVANEPTAAIPIQTSGDKTVAVGLAPSLPTAMAAPPEADVAVASPSRAAETHGALPPAVGLADRPRSPLAWGTRRLPAALVGLLGLVLAVGVLAAANSGDSGSAGAAPSVRPAGVAKPTVKPTAAPTKAPKGGHGKAHGKDEGGD
jgi:serine/threonine-protein kinase